MNWIKRLFTGETKQSGGMFMVGPSHATQMDAISPDEISRDAYRKLAVAYRCVNLISDAVAGVKLNLFQGDEELDKHPVIDLLKKPNPVQTYQTFTKCAISYFSLHGNSFIQGLASDIGKPPSWLLCHRTSRMQIKPGKFLMPSEYILRINQGETHHFPVDVMGRSQILHMKTFNPLDDFWGQSPITPAATDVDMVNSSNMWNLSLIQNSARPSGAFMYTGDGVMNADKRRILRKDIDDLWTKTTTAGTPLLLGGKMDFKELSLSPKDMDFLNSKKVSKADIAIAFGVPAQLVGIEGSQTFANYQQAVLSFYTETVLNISKMYVEALNNWLVASFDKTGNLRLVIDEDSIIALEPLRKAQWEKAKAADWLTPNEKRELTGYPLYDPTEDPADQLYINAGLIPLGEDTGTLEVVEPDDSDDDDDGKQKSFNINSRRGKRQFLIEQNKKRSAITKRMKSQLNAAFIMEGKEIIRAIEGAQSNEMIEIIIKEVIADNAKTFAPILSANITSAMRRFGIDTIRAMGKKAAADKLDFTIRRFIETEVGSKITNLARTSQKRVIKKVREAILAAELEGQSVAEASKAIKKIYKDFTKNRSTVIARTEIHNAAMKGSVEGAKATGVQNLMKEWVSNFQGAFRQNHDGPMDGEKVPINEKFMVPSLTGSDVPMDGPGDSSAPADQVINCSCVLVYSET